MADSSDAGSADHNSPDRERPSPPAPDLQPISASGQSSDGNHSAGSSGQGERPSSTGQGTRPSADHELHGAFGGVEGVVEGAAGEAQNQQDVSQDRLSIQNRTALVLLRWRHKQYTRLVDLMMPYAERLPPPDMDRDLLERLAEGKPTFEFYVAQERNAPALRDANISMRDMAQLENAREWLTKLSCVRLGLDPVDPFGFNSN